MSGMPFDSAQFAKAKNVIRSILFEELEQLNYSMRPPLLTGIVLIIFGFLLQMIGNIPS